MDAFVISLRLSKKLILKPIGHRKSEIAPPKCIECELEYKRHSSSRNIVSQIWEGTYKVLSADFESSVELQHL